jgi:adenosylcobinamide-phosphate synthase
MLLPGLYDPLLLLFIGLVVDGVLGEMGPLFRHVPHPVVLAGAVIGFLEKRLNRPERNDGTRRVRGILTVVVLVGAAAAIGWGVHRLCRDSLIGAAIEALTIAVLLAQRSLYDHVAAVGEALATGGLAAGREAVGHIVGRDPQRLDAAGVARAALESLAENFSDGVVAPAFWYLLLGLPGLFAYKMANTLDSMIGHRSARYLAFGWAAARLDDMLNLVPAPLAGGLIATAAAFDRATSANAAWRTLRRDGRRHHSPNAGWPEAALAGALGIALAGPRHYPEGTVDDPYLGDGTPDATVSDIARGLRLYLRACAILVGLVLGAWLSRHVTLPW